MYPEETKSEGKKIRSKAVVTPVLHYIQAQVKWFGHVTCLPATKQGHLETS